MFKIDILFFFMFVFTCLILLKNLTKFISALLQKEPQPMVYGNRDLIILGLSISYFITYIHYQ